MTSSLGIAATTAVLRRLLQNAIPASSLTGLLGTIDVSALPPDRIDVTSESSRLNLFMYMARPNTGWSNTELPSHDATGRRLTNPPLALDLNYMLSAYGGANFHGEILLGYGALLLHQTRVVTRDAIKATFAGASLPPDLALLATAGLDGQEELIKLSLDPLTIDEVSRLWQVFGERYRPSMAFRATVLLMRGTDAAVAPGPPVVRARLGLTTTIHPSIASVEPAVVPAAVGATVDLVGTGLLTADTTVRFGSGESAPPAAGSTPLRVSVGLPTTLRAGVNSVRVQQAARFEGDLRAGPESNVAPFTLLPAFARASGGGPDIAVGTRVDTPTTTSTTISAKVVPAVGKRQRAELLLDETGAAPGAALHSYAVPAASREADAADATDTLSFALADVRRARYLVRVRVDGAESGLGMTSGVYDSPVVDLT